MLRIKEVAELAGISKRTLQYYDDIGLLCPFKTESGYRLYDRGHLDDLQQILFFRELGFPLKDISKLMGNPSFEHGDALKKHRKMLEKKQNRIGKIIATIDKTLKNIKGGCVMSDNEKFEGFDFSSNNSHEKEAREKWGDKSVDETKGRLKRNKKEMSKEMNDIYRKLATIRHLDPESDEAQRAIGEWFSFLNSIGSYSLDAFEGLGKMYVEDERFTNNIDKFGVGLAAFMKDAMKVYAKNNK
jgi:DNA-binding transcriptional MerR regulator